MEAQVLAQLVVLLGAVEERVDWVAGRVVEEACLVEVVELLPADRGVVDLVRAVEVVWAGSSEAAKVKSEVSPAGWEDMAAVLVEARRGVAMAAAVKVVETVAATRVAAAARVVALMGAGEELEPVPAGRVAATVAAERVLEQCVPLSSTQLLAAG